MNNGCLTLSDPLIRGEWRNLKSWEGAVRAAYKNNGYEVNYC